MAYSGMSLVRNNGRSYAFAGTPQLAEIAGRRECEVIRLKPFAGFDAERIESLWAITRDCINRVGYSETRGRIIKRVEDELKLRASSGQYVYFLDAGAGDGLALIDAERISDRIRAYGLSMGASDPELRIPRERWFQGYFEGTVFREKDSKEGFFDVIQSCNALIHAVDRPRALGNMLNSLRPDGGRIIIGPDIGSHIPFYDTLRKQGFAIERGRGLLETITRKNGAEADLSEFYGEGVMKEYPW